MITYDNINLILDEIKYDYKKLYNRILNSNKEFIVLEVFCTNTGHSIFAKLTNNYDRYKNVSNSGGVILYLEEVQNILAD
jgi:hypothetical protein